ncbi:WD repeat-containing protein 49 isoform 1 [Quillaja saponaria]|uniref:WD repeat-containing protein 49 isoform 1 n=1 Tax=Quillaja saponaria TaxID=32244 RepID=A0AAD7PPF1_QUISA|nr:WD repeat-containing protein 49 isoform 1 [Quillaja saponaria]
MKATRRSWCRQSRPVSLSSNLCSLHFSRQINFPYQQKPCMLLRFTHSKGLKLYGNGLFQSTCVVTNAVYGREDGYGSSWDDQPFEILPNGKKLKKFLRKGDIDCCTCLQPRLISRAWQVAGTRYEDPKLANRTASKLLSYEDDVMLEYYNCRTSGGPMPIAWINVFKKALFSSKDRKAYGRIIGGSVVAAFANSIAPLYFMVSQLKEVMSTEQPCDLAYEFGDGLFDIQDFPQGFPRPAKHPYPFNDQLVIYVRYLGPGVSVGQAWQEGKALEQVPRKLCGEILMVKDYTELRRKSVKESK